MAHYHSLAACRTFENSLNVAERLVISRNDQSNKILKFVIKLYSETLYFCVFFWQSYVISDHLTHTGCVSAPLFQQIKYVYVLWEEVGLQLTVYRALRLGSFGNCFIENLVMLDCLVFVCVYFTSISKYCTYGLWSMHDAW